jgi:hypothetical protein
MKPFTSGSVIAAWLLRLTVAGFVYLNYAKGFPAFDLKSFSFYIHSAYMMFAVLLIVGGFMQKPTLTVVSGLFLFVLPIVLLIHSFPDDLLSGMLLYLIPLSTGFFFFTAGNNN